MSQWNEFWKMQGFRYCRASFSMSSNTSDLKMDSPVGTLPGARHCRVCIWDWSARCQYTVTGWGRQFDQQLLSQCGSMCTCVSRLGPEIHRRVAGERRAAIQQTSGRHQNCGTRRTSASIDSILWHQKDICFYRLNTVAPQGHLLL